MNHPNKVKGHGCDPVSFQNDTNNDLNFATGTRRSKAIATQIAQLAIAGHVVHPLADGGYLVCKYGYIHNAPDFEALQALDRRLGVSK